MPTPEEVQRQFYLTTLKLTSSFLSLAELKALYDVSPQRLAMVPRRKDLIPLAKTADISNFTNKTV